MTPNFTFEENEVKEIRCWAHGHTANQWRAGTGSQGGLTVDPRLSAQLLPLLLFNTVGPVSYRRRIMDVRPTYSFLKSFLDHGFPAATESDPGSRHCPGTMPQTHQTPGCGRTGCDFLHIYFSLWL